MGTNWGLAVFFDVRELGHREVDVIASVANVSLQMSCRLSSSIGVEVKTCQHCLVYIYNYIYNIFSKICSWQLMWHGEQSPQKLAGSMPKAKLL